MKWSASPDRYQRQVLAGFGIWLDNESDQRGWDPANHARNYFTPAEFEQTVRHALATSDRYVWIYSQKPRWWNGERVPPEYVKALARAGEVVAPVAPRRRHGVGRSSPSMVSRIREIGGKPWARSWS